MKELIINIPEDAVEFVEEFIERIGGIIESGRHKEKISDKERVLKPRPLDFFGTWKDIPLDPQNYRKRLWRETPEL